MRLDASRHLDDGVVRRALDEPDALAPAQRTHRDGCVRCARRSDEIAAAAARASATFGRMPVSDAAWEGARTGVAARLRRRSVARGSRVRLAGVLTTASLGAALACAAFVMALTPMRSLANGFLAVFAPRSIAAIALDSQDVASLRALPGLAAFGTLRSRRDALVYNVPDATQATLAVRFPVRAAHYVPAAASSAPLFVVSGQTTTDFTFDATLAARSAASAGTLLPPMPAGLDGSTLEATFGPTVVTTYAASDRALAPANVLQFATDGGAAPPLAIVQLPIPRVTSNGASAATIESYLLSQPGISPHLAAQLAALGDLATTLPIIVPIDRAFARPALIRGIAGVTFGDESGRLAGAVWQEHGMLYAVYGREPLHEIAAVAQSLQ